MKFAANFKTPKFILAFTFLIIASLIIVKFAIGGKVLGQKEQQVEPLRSPTQSSPSTNPSASPSTRLEPAKSTYSIAIYGDSMVDTMGDNLDYVAKALTAEYPQTKFNLYNYGIGSQNIEEGLARFGKEFVYKVRKYPPITTLKPDIIIVGSFAYNPFPTHNPSKHLRLLGELVKKSKSITTNVYLLAEIAPMGSGFGKGTNGVNWPDDIAVEHAGKIAQQLKNATNFSKSTNTKLLDAFSETKSVGDFSSGAYTDGNDGIHPSVRGHVLMANLIVRNIELD